MNPSEIPEDLLHPQDDRCDCSVIHEETVRRVRESLPDEGGLYELADLFKVFSDSTRIRILAALAESELCVCDVAYLLDLTQSAVSHQLRTLKQTKLVRSRREGRIVFYSLADGHVKSILALGLSHVTEG
jgi:ArsR family transcriptional regulator